jgi:hypothetical protein
MKITAEKAKEDVTRKCDLQVGDVYTVKAYPGDGPYLILNARCFRVEIGGSVKERLIVNLATGEMLWSDPKSPDPVVLLDVKVVVTGEKVAR